MSYDGSIIIDTSIDSSGFENGLAGLGVLAEGVLQSVASALAQAGGQMATGLSDALNASIPLLAEAGGILAAQLADNVSADTVGMAEAAGQLLGTLHGALLAGAGPMGAAGTALVNALRGPLQAGDWGSLGSAMVNGIAAGVVGAAGTLVSAAVTAVQSALNAAKSYLRIGSPSKLFRDEVGKMIPAGIAEGVRAGTPALTTSLGGHLSDLLSQARAATGGTAPGEAINRPAGQTGTSVPAVTNLYQTVYTHDSLSPYELTREAEDFLRRERWAIP